MRLKGRRQTYSNASTPQTNVPNAAIGRVVCRRMYTLLGALPDKSVLPENSRGCPAIQICSALTRNIAAMQAPTPIASNTTIFTVGLLRSVKATNRQLSGMIIRNATGRTDNRLFLAPLKYGSASALNAATYPADSMPTHAVARKRSRVVNWTFIPRIVANGRGDRIRQFSTGCKSRLILRISGSGSV